MIIKRIYICLTVLIIIFSSPRSYSYFEGTHQAINEHVTETDIDGFSLNDFLKDNLGFNGINEELSGIDAERRNVSKNVLEWIGYGGFQEDRPGSYKDYITDTPSRSNNHFHNPLKPWDDAGLDDSYLVLKRIPIS